MNIHRLLLSSAACLIAALPIAAQVPNLITYQGRVAVGTTNFDGSGQFKFALVNGDGSTTYWSNDDTSTAGSQPTAAVSLTVTKGLYSVLLGDTALTNMSAIPASVFSNTDVRLRVWFNDGTNGVQQFTPDQRLAAVGYAVVAATVSDAAITSAKIAPGTIDSTHLASSLTLGGTTNGTFSGGLTGNVTGNAVNFTGSLVGDVTGTQGATAISAAMVTGKVLTGFVSGSGTVTASDTLLTAINKLNGNDALKAPLASPTFTGTVTAPNFTTTGIFSLPVTSGASVGVISQNGSRMMHSYGTSNFFAGVDAGNFTMNGGNNTATGSLTLVANTTGFGNAAFGASALRQNTTGNFNTATGQGALFSNTTGSSNTANGSNTLNTATTGSANTAIGDGTMFRNTTGGSNTATGKSALHDNTIGSQNTATGYFALSQNTTGTNNIALGYNAGSNLTTGSGNIAIGHVGVAGEVNIIRIGTSQTDTFLTGIIHGDGSGLTGIAPAAGSVTSTQLASGLTLGGTTTGSFSGPLAGNASTATSATTATTATTAGSFTGSLAGDVTGTQGATAISAATVTGKALTGYVSGSGTVAATDTILQAINKVNGNVALKAPLASPTFTGTVTATAFSGNGSGLTGVTASSTATTANFDIPSTNGAGSQGVITQGGSRLIHTFGTNNFFAGPSAGNFTMTGVSNIGIGNRALFSNTTGVGNTASGYAALNSNTTGYNNTASGQNALYSNTIGNNNTASGINALLLNRTGSQNVAIGNSALLMQGYSPGSDWPSNNTAVGFEALKFNEPTSTVTGIDNTALGASALTLNTTGFGNAASGKGALESNTTGYHNTASGAYALASNTTGASNIAIGRDAGYSLTTGDGNIVIGHYGVAAESATIRLGTSQTKAFVAGIRGTTTDQANAVNVVIDSNGQLGTISSSRRYKEEIVDMGDASARIQALRPVTFRYKQAYADGEKPIQFGLIAEEVAETFPELAVFNAEGQPETVKYQDLTPMLLNEVQKQQRRADAKDGEIGELKKRLVELEAKDKAREARLAKLEQFMPPAPKGGAAKAR